MTRAKSEQEFTTDLLTDLASNAATLPGPWLLRYLRTYGDPRHSTEQLWEHLDDLQTAVDRRSRLESGMSKWAEEYPDLRGDSLDEVARERACEDVDAALRALTGPPRAGVRRLLAAVDARPPAAPLGLVGSA